MSGFCQCGDHGTHDKATDKCLCRECHAELTKGIVLSPIIGIGDVSGGRGGPLDDDIGSYRTIALRCLEDG